MKKGEKNFYHLDRCQLQAPQPNSKSFLLLFFKKEALSYCQHLPDCQAPCASRRIKALRSNSATIATGATPPDHANFALDWQPLQTWSLTVSEKFVIETAKAAKDLDAAYSKVKSSAKNYGFTSVTELRSEVVKKAMTDNKKGADFIVEVDFVGKTLIAQLVCDVKGKMRSVIGRREIKDVKEFKAVKGLAANQSLDKTAEQILL